MFANIPYCTCYRYLLAISELLADTFLYVIISILCGLGFICWAGGAVYFVGFEYKRLCS